jgi:hypothetical protein
MRTTLLLIVVLLALGGLGAWWMWRGPDASRFADLQSPRISRLSDQKMLVVEATGDPNVVGAGAFSLLFNSYFKLDGVSRFGRPPAPRARWLRPESTPKDQWVGHYAMPVPEAAAAPSTELTGTLRIGIATWVYGEVAEVLHVGPYSTEAPDIERLHQFITASGYRVIGEHEEEYVKGPGMMFAGSPERYLTIIRLRIEKTR